MVCMPERRATASRSASSRGAEVDEEGQVVVGGETV